jgi:ubiquinone/menaquinone biosynthesis methyltransferase
LAIEPRDTLPPLRVALATPATKGRYVRRLFATIADRYDFITIVLSCGQDRRWKRRLARLAAVTAEDRVLDLATGTGDIAWQLAPDAGRVVGLDLTPRMIELAAAKVRSAGPSIRAPAFLVGDMVALPFPDSSFDVVTTGYGVRNVPDAAAALGEIYRVLKPGGRMLSLDFNRPANRVVRAVYLAYLTAVGAGLGLLLHRDPDTYRYIPESIRGYPGADGLTRLMAGLGFEQTRYLPVLGGLLAINLGARPGGARGPQTALHTAR